MMMKPTVTAVCENAAARRRKGRRGVAMLLVILAMGIGTILAGTFLASKSNSSSIGQNVASATASRWSAKAAADIGVAILQTSLDWRTKAATGVLMNSQPIAGGNAIVTLTNLSGQPPTATDREVIMTVTATVNGVPSKVQRIVKVPPPPPVGVVDLGLDEFTLFATEGLTVDASGVVAVWSSSPEALTTEPVKVGVGFTSGASMILDPGAVILRSELYTPSTASVGLQSQLSSGVFIGGAVLPLAVPALSWSVSGKFAFLPPIGADITISGQTVTLAPGAYQNVTITNGSVVTIDGLLSPRYSFNDLTIDAGSVVIINDHVRIWIKDDLRITGRSALELGAGVARLTAFVYDNLIIRDSSVGFPRAVGFDPTRSRVSPRKYTGPNRIRFQGVYRTAPDANVADDAMDFAFPGMGTSSGGQDIRLATNSMVVASFETPGAATEISNGSTLYGRITARLIDIQSTAAVLGDPSLNNNAGFTTLNSSLYDVNGNPIPALVTALAAIVPSAGVSTNQLAIQTQIAGAVVAPPAPPPPAGGATPRLASNAVAREWPVPVMALEIMAPPAPTQFSGSYLSTKTTAIAPLDAFGVPQFTITSVTGSNGAIP